ncbi:MAG: serine/threonine-protein kinase, partial [Lachnospiraceae bacterium]|nr:serine/threonine-protein kinase [Lachnospiraceae bacterium]
GTTVSLKLVTDTGVTLLDTKTSSFPYSISFDHIDAPGGTLTITYTVNTAGETIVDPETGETVVTEGRKETKSFTRRIDFVRD